MYFHSKSTQRVIFFCLSCTTISFLVWFSRISDLGTGIEPSPLQVRSNYGRLGIPQGVAIALPSVRISEETEKIERKGYGGAGDKVHLGGFTEFDGQGVSPEVWKDMVQYMGVKSVIDVGCGRGTSTSWFVLHGLETACVEGSHDAIEKSIVPKKESVYTEHDFSRGPWWPAKTYDAVWSVDFLEHVGRNFQQNYMPVFQSAAIIIATSSMLGGWHHVEVHSDEWWIARMQSYGFVYSKALTDRVKGIAEAEKIDGDSTEMFPIGDKFNAEHLWLTVKVFINPAVASLPEHQHLLSEHGCFDKKEKGMGRGEWLTKPCSVENKETELPDEFLPLTLTKEMDDKWKELVRSNI